MCPPWVRLGGGGGGSRSASKSKYLNDLWKSKRSTGEKRQKAAEQVQNRYSGSAAVRTPQVHRMTSVQPSVSKLSTATFSRGSSRSTVVHTSTRSTPK
jgi:hypothetical protein